MFLNSKTSSSASTCNSWRTPSNMYSTVSVACAVVCQNPPAKHAAAKAIPMFCLYSSFSKISIKHSAIIVMKLSTTAAKFLPNSLQAGKTVNNGRPHYIQPPAHLFLRFGYVCPPSPPLVIIYLPLRIRARTDSFASGFPLCLTDFFLNFFSSITHFNPSPENPDPKQSGYWPPADGALPFSCAVLRGSVRGVSWSSRLRKGLARRGDRDRRSGCSPSPRPLRERPRELALRARPKRGGSRRSKVIMEFPSPPANRTGRMKRTFNTGNPKISARTTLPLKEISQELRSSRAPFMPAPIRKANPARPASAPRRSALAKQTPRAPRILRTVELSTHL